MNTYYKQNLKAVMQVAKKYTDDKIEQALELLEDYELSSETISQTSQTATAPSDVRTSSLIEVGGNCVKYAPSTASDNSVAYKKSIPNNTFNLLANKIGGMSYKSENLFNKSTANIGKALSTINGTLYDSSNDMVSDYIEVIPNTQYSDNVPNVQFNICYYNENKTFISGETKVTPFTTPLGAYYIRIQALKTRLDTFMIVSGSTAPTEYKEYFDGIRNTAVSQLTVRGANLLQLSDVAETTTNGITYKVENGVITLNGTATTGFDLRFYYASIDFLGDYGMALFFNKNVTFTSVGIIAYNKFTAIENTNYYGGTKIYSSSYTANYGFIRFVEGDVVNNVTMKIMIIKGSTAPTEYKPYVTPIIKTIPSEIQALTGYGWGINDTCYNYIDFERKVFVQKVGRVDLGTLTWTLQNSGNSAYFDAYLGGVLQSITLLCEKYNSEYVFTSNTNDKSVCTVPNSIRIRDLSYTDATIFKTILNGVYLYYELPTPIETDVSQYLVGFNPIETNDLYGEIEFVNTYNQDMPNEISFVGTIKETLVTSFTIGNETTNITDTIESDGWSASNSVYNYRKTRDKERHKVVGRVDLGTLTYGYRTDYTNPTFTSDSLQSIIKANGIGLCSLYVQGNNANFTALNNMEFAIRSDFAYLYIVNTNYTTVEAFKTAMSGVYLYYELATPEVTPLDVDTDFHYIDLESGETITFNNANNQACHNTIRYSIMEEKV